MVGPLAVYFKRLKTHALDPTAPLLSTIRVFHKLYSVVCDSDLQP